MGRSLCFCENTQIYKYSHSLLFETGDGLLIAEHLLEESEEKILN